MLIAHTTDLSLDDRSAFVHALALASASGSHLVSVHAGVQAEPDESFPDAARLLSRWSRDPHEVSHEKVTQSCCDDPADTLVDALARLKPDLVVAATHARSGVRRLFAGSVAEGVARNIRAPTLLLPLGGRAFVDETKGTIEIDTLLVPVGSAREAAAGVDAAIWLMRSVGREQIRLVTVHADDGTPAPRPSVPPGVTIERRIASGSLSDAVIQLANEIDAALVVMATHGHDGVADVLLGSHAERLLHHCQRPMLWVPMRHAGH